MRKSFYTPHISVFSIYREPFNAPTEPEVIPHEPSARSIHSIITSNEPVDSTLKLKNAFYDSNEASNLTPDMVGRRIQCYEDNISYQNAVRQRLIVEKENYNKALQNRQLASLNNKINEYKLQIEKAKANKPLYKENITDDVSV